jgi:Acyl-CoA reductase (LuxC)
MEIEERVAAFVKLGEFIKNLPQEKFKSLAESIRLENPWFTEDSVRMAVSGLLRYLDEKNLLKWVKRYSPAQHRPRVVLLIMAGNIPLAGFHDLLSVLINGDVALIKLSSKDTVFLKFLASTLIDLFPDYGSKIRFEEPFKNFDAVIATGSDNSSRYFDYYFGKYPHIIRKNRTSAAILEGNENTPELSTLGSDVFSYFGLGCRNVSKLFVRQEYDFRQLFESWESYNTLSLHHKYYNNYIYQKSIFAVSQQPHLDNGFVLLQESQKLVSPLAVVYYEFYKDQKELIAQVDESREKIQCIVGNIFPASVRFGEAQMPGLMDYADDVDTMSFLQTLGKGDR